MPSIRLVLIMLRGYCDESYDDKYRVYVVAGYVGKDREWRILSKDWRNRILKDGVTCFHATDCEAGRRQFANLSKQQRIDLKTARAGPLAPRYRATRKA